MIMQELDQALPLLIQVRFMEQWTATVNETIYLVLFSSYTLNPQFT
jgi:hypothetical protein